MEKALNKYKITFMSIFGFEYSIEGDNLTFLYCSLPCQSTNIKFYKNIQGNWKEIKCLEEL